MQDVLLKIHKLNKHFGGVQALSDISLAIHHHEIFGLIGPNGAGKTTLFNVLTGVYTPDSGQILFNGMSLEKFSAHRVVSSGIARTFQNIRLFPQMTALENVMVGQHVRTRAGVVGAIFRNARTVREEYRVKEQALYWLAYVGLSAYASEYAKNLPYGYQRRLEIARALATEPLLVALDEPAAGMNASETVMLKNLVERIRDDGKSVLLIEHDVRFVMGVCDRVAVLDFGNKIADGTPAVIQSDRRVIEAYLGGSSDNRAVAGPVCERS